MKIAVYRVPGRTHEDHLCAMQRGLARHGIQTEFFSDMPTGSFDACVVWGWAVGKRVRDSFDCPMLVMERGYIGDRFEWTSCGWDGLNGRARFTQVDDGKRFNRHFGHMLKDWKKSDGGYSLIAGQVATDHNVAHINILSWYRDVAVRLWRAGMKPMFRQHPVDTRRNVEMPAISFADIVDGTLEEAFSVADMLVTYNSNSAIDALMSGIPVHVEDAGSMVYDLASHDLTKVYPDREPRLQQVAWCQFSMSELKSGDAWDTVRLSMERK